MCDYRLVITFLLGFLLLFLLLGRGVATTSGGRLLLVAALLFDSSGAGSVGAAILHHGRQLNLIGYLFALCRHLFVYVCIC